MRIRTGFMPTLAVIGAIAAIAASGAQATTYTYTGFEQTFAVPSNVTGVNVVAVGAPGASFGTTYGGGPGGEVIADLPLPAGTSTLYVEVGGNGADGSGGWNGGGGGPLGGGGASDVRTVSCSAGGGDCAKGGSTTSLNSRLAIAGGGGGASDDGPGGSSDQAGGVSNGALGPAEQLGGGGGGSGPGTAVSAMTVKSDCQGYGDQDGEVGSAGNLGLGGAGAYLFLTGTPESGGGGGGLYGGGGGAQCYDSGADASANAGAGGGGSDYVTPAAPISSVQVSTGDDIDPSEVIITAPVPSATSTPAVTGELAVGDALSETHANWTTPAGEPITDYTYQWQRCNAYGTSCTAIVGATAQTYALTAADLGDTIRVQEAAENFYGTSATPSTSAAGGVIGEPPMSTTPPEISGTPAQGQSLVETHGAWAQGPVAAYGYQWMRCSAGSCTPISGAINQDYTLRAADVGSTIEVQETATNPYGVSAPATSAATSTVQPLALLTLSVSPLATSSAGRIVGGRCVKPTPHNNRRARCVRAVRLTIRYTLAVADTVTFTLERETPGRTVNSKCVKPTGRNRHNKHCSQLIRVHGSIVISSNAGANSLAFNGRIGGRTLAPATYQLIGTPSGGKPNTTTFTIT